MYNIREIVVRSTGYKRNLTFINSSLNVPGFYWNHNGFTAWFLSTNEPHWSHWCSFRTDFSLMVTDKEGVFSA